VRSGAAAGRLAPVTALGERPAGSGRSDAGPAAPVAWGELVATAVAAAARAYAPYSRLRVGAAARASDGRIVVGCNVENASYGLSLCAECVLVGALVAGGGGRLTQLACVSGSGEILMPCGRCRQVLYEHGGPGLLVTTGAGPRPLGTLLPDAFGPADLPVGPADRSGDAAGDGAGRERPR
jgi:cytidine deaminase